MNNSPNTDAKITLSSDDERGGAIITLSGDGAEVCVHLTPETCKEVAADLIRCAFKAPKETTP